MLVLKKYHREMSSVDTKLKLPSYMPKTIIIICTRLPYIVYYDLVGLEPTAGVLALTELTTL